MKEKDIILIIVIAFVSGVASFFLSNALITNDSNRSTKVEVVEPISSELAPLDARYFNAQSQNPTQLIEIQDNNNQQPL